MIQRKQTLFLLLSVLSGIGLLFIPCYTVFLASAKLDVYLVPVVSEKVHSSIGHLAAISSNFAGLVLASLTVFLYLKRELQLKLSYTLMLLWIVMILMLAFCPFIKTGEGITVKNTYFGCLIGVVGMIAAYLSARSIKKDIDLLKSADRIR